MKEGYSVRQLSQMSGHGVRKLESIIHVHLSHLPPQKDTLIAQHIVVDGTLVEGRRGCLLAVMNAFGHTILDGEQNVREIYGDLVTYLSSLRKKGLDPLSATVDGNPALFNALECVWPDIIIQRCVVHVQRQGLSWCRRRPKTPSARHLRDLFLVLTEITTKEQMSVFLQRCATWDEKYGRCVSSYAQRGWVASDLRRARSMLFHALPHLFYYLDDPNIPSSTNGLEGYFSRLKDHYRRHRGLARHRRLSYFKWYFYLSKH